MLFCKSSTMERKFSSLKLNDKNFPSLLKEIQNPPKEIFISGDLPENEAIKIAIVGTRKATLIGKTIAKQIAEELAKLGVIIVSGLAMGIDSSAHQGVINAKGKTIAVMANGLDKIYPAQNENLAQEILNFHGTLISEYPKGTPSYPNQFLERNRIISGLSIATIVIEAPDRSGSLTTARFALEQGREVLVLPGPADHPNYSGSHKLIRDGARLITSVQDILEDLNLELIKNTKTSLNNLFDKTTSFDKNHSLILTAIAEHGKSLNIDKICELTKLSSQTVNQSIATLIIEGIVKETENGYCL